MDKFLYWCRIPAYIALMTLCWYSFFILTSIHLTYATQHYSSMKNYVHPSGFFSLIYPEEWSVEYNSPDNKFEKPQIIFSNENSNSRLLIEIESPVSINFTEDVNGLDYYLNKLKAEYPNIIIEKSSYTAYKIDSKMAFSFLFKIPIALSFDNNLYLEGIKIFFPINPSKEIEITFTTFESNFTEQIQIVDKMLNSLKIKYDK